MRHSLLTMEVLRTYLLSSFIFCLLSLAAGRYEIRRLVPSGPDPVEPPETPSTSFTKTHFGVKRLVPSGPNPVEPPETPSTSFTKTYFGVKRLVPSGPDPVEPPETPSSIAQEEAPPSW